MSPKYFPPFQLGNQTRDTRENIFQGKLEPLRKKQVIEKYFTQDELDLVLGDSLEKTSQLSSTLKNINNMHQTHAMDSISNTFWSATDAMFDQTF